MNAEHTFESPIDRLFYWAEQQPDVTFLNQPIDNKIIRYSWQQAAHEVACVANYLSNLPPNSKVAIISLNCAHWMMADWAIMMAGHVSVPIYPTASQKTIDFVLRHAEVKAVFVGKLYDTEQVMSAIPDGIKKMSCYLPIQSLPFWDDLVAKNDALSYQSDISANQLMSIVYTSGTTGEPKGVMMAFNAANEVMKLINARVDVGPSDRYVSYLPLAHIAERMGVEFVTLYKGSQVFFVRSLDQFVVDVRRAKPTIFFGVPRIWQKLKMAIDDKLGGSESTCKKLNLPFIGQLLKRLILRRMGFSHLRFAISAAAPVSKSLLKWYQQLGIKVNEAYGMTESSGLSHMTANDSTLFGSVGQPLPGCECHITAQGEVCIRNPAVMLGYYKKPELTQSVIDEDGWLHTGDLGHEDDLGNLFISGRIKDLFKTAKGKYVAPIPIEAQVLRRLAVEHVVLMGSGLGQPVLVVSVAQAYLNSAVFEKKCMDLLTDLQTTLEAHEKPSHVFMSGYAWSPENGLLTPTLKIQRQHVEGYYLEKMAPYLNKPGVYRI